MQWRGANRRHQRQPNTQALCQTPPPPRRHSGGHNRVPSALGGPCGDREAPGGGGGWCRTRKGTPEDLQSCMGPIPAAVRRGKPRSLC